MNYPILDRVRESSTTEGTGTIALLGAVLGYQPFSVVGDGAKLFYCIEGVNILGVPTGDWEVGEGTYSLSGPSLSRDVVLESSNSDLPVAFPAGNKNVFLTIPSKFFNELVSTGSGPPGPTYGLLGSIYFDVSDPTDPKFWWKE